MPVRQSTQSPHKSRKEPIITDHQQAAIEAAAQQHSPHLWDGRFRDSLLLLRCFTPEIADEAVEKRRAEILAEAQEYIAAAEPHLRKKWAGEARKLLNMRADFQGPHATARNRGIHDVISLLEGAGE